MVEPWLGIVGHGTTGADGIESGIHLRWQFRPEMGFPLGGFQLHRRPTATGPKPLCFWFQRAATGSVPAETLAGGEKVELTLVGGAMRIAERQVAKPPYSGAGEFLPPDVLGSGRGMIKVLDLTGHAPAPLELHARLPYTCREVSLLFEHFAGGQLAVEALDGSRRVDAVTQSPRDSTIQEIKLSGPVITGIVLKVTRAALIRVCIRRAEPCDDRDAWEPLGDAICVPVYYEGRPCKGHDSPDCDDLEVRLRLPKDPCDYARYAGAVTRDVVEALRVVVADDPDLPQAERPLPGSTEIDDCAAPGERVPSIDMPVMDALLMAALEPAIARVLGLYHVDHPPAGSFDYKVTGIWPEGTLWRLPESWTIDDMKLGRLWMNLFVAGPFRVLARTRPTVIRRPNAKLGTTRALAFLDTDAADWNFPAAFFWDRPEDRAVEIFLPEPAGEVQVYVGQDTPHVELRARDEGGTLSAPVVSVHRNAVLAAQAPPDKLIRSVSLKGGRFWIYRIAWGEERIPHGLHCAITYDHSVRAQARPPKPAPPVAHALPGLVQKAPDCQPLATGATRDARFSIGLDWKVPDDLGGPAGDVAVRYDVIRVDAAGHESSASGDSPVLIGVHDDDAPAPPYAPPPGWPPEPLRFTDTALTPGAYRYRLRAIDIFGRRSDASDSSAAVVPKPPPPPAPVMRDAVMLERADRHLLAADLALLPDGSNEAIRIRWIWSDTAERAAPDAFGFQVYSTEGVPNVLEGTVQPGVVVAGGQATVTLDLAGVPAPEAQLLVGRELRQGRHAFRIISHSAGAAEAGGVRIVLKARVPPGPSGTAPEPGPATVALDAIVPVEVREVAAAGGELSLKLRTKALATMPAAGIVGGELRLQGERLKIASVEAGSVFADAGSEWISRCTVPAGTDLAELAAALPPLFVGLALPTPALYRDYHARAAWPNQLGPMLPRTTSGDFSMLVRDKVGVETAGLSQPSAGFYLLLVDALPAALDVDQNRPRRQMAFGVSCLGPDDLESAVAAPAVLTRVYRASAADLAAAADVPLTLPPPDDHAYAGAPNFAGKATWRLSWPAPAGAGWTYQVYRALADTLFKADKLIRQETPAVGANGRFPIDVERDTFVNAYPDYVRAAVRDLVVNPGTLDRAAIEDHDYVDTLLQALASLPRNEAAFTRLDLEVKVIGGQCVCVDDTLDGRAEGVYLYRVRAIGPAVNVSELGRAMAPVWVRGALRLPTPIWHAGYSEASRIVLEWNAGTAQVTRYAVFRAEGSESLPHAAHMGPPSHEGAADSFAQVDVGSGRTVLQWADNDVRPGTTYSYRIQAGSDAGFDAQAVSPSINATARIPLVAPRPDVTISGAGKPEISWPATPFGADVLVQHAHHTAGPWIVRNSWVPGSDLQYVDLAATPGEPHLYRLLVRIAGRVSAASPASDPVVI